MCCKRILEKKSQCYFFKGEKCRETDGYPVPILTKISLWAMRRSRGSTARDDFVLFPATGFFEQQLKLSDAVSHVPEQTCPGTATVPCNWLQVFDPSSERVTWGVGTDVGIFVTYSMGIGVGVTVFTTGVEVQPAARIQRMRMKIAGLTKQRVWVVIMSHRSGLMQHPERSMSI